MRLAGMRLPRERSLRERIERDAARGEIARALRQRRHVRQPRLGLVRLDAFHVHEIER